MKTNLKLIIEAIENATSSELLELNNRYCEVMKYPDDIIECNDDEFFETNFNGKTLSALSAAFCGDYNPNHKFVKFNGLANLESFDFIDTSNLVDSVSGMAKRIEEDFYRFSDCECFSELEEIDEDETEDEE